MIDCKAIEEAARKICDRLPEGLKSAKHDFEAQVKNILHSSFDKMDLVTRDEFEQQKRILAHCQEKLDQIEKQLADKQTKEHEE